MLSLAFATQAQEMNGDWRHPVTFNARPGNRRLALASLDENADHK